MKWQIFSIGKPSLSYAKQGIAEYQKRLRRYSPVEISHGKEAGKEKNSQHLLNASEGYLRIALDERGDLLTTREIADQVSDWQMDGVKKVGLIIGGADGHSEELRAQADHVWSLSKMTLQHELALVVLLEQIYRVHTLLKGEPYHRD